MQVELEDNEEEQLVFDVVLGIQFEGRSKHKGSQNKFQCKYFGRMGKWL